MNIIVPKGDDGTVSRADMPQLDDADIPSLLAYLGTLNVKFTAGEMDPLTVRAHQAIDIDKAMAIPQKWLKTPVLISQEPIVIDGDHRWYRHCVDKTKMPYIQLEAEWHICLKYIFAFPQTYEEKA
jgi:hypothetical protein